MSVLWGFADAVRYLTVVQLPLSQEERDAGRPWTAALFPAVGLLVGLVLAAVLALPLPSLPAAALAVAAWVSLTGDRAKSALSVVLRFGALAVLTPAVVVSAPLIGAWAIAVSDSLTPPVDSAEPGELDGHLGALTATGVAMVLLLVLAILTRQPTVMLAWLVGALVAGGWGWWVWSRAGTLADRDHRTVGAVAEVATLYALILLSAI